MTISYNLDIPDGPNNPSNDQPKMKVNTNAIDSWTAVDHVRFSASPAGTHKQVTFSSNNVPTPPVVPPILFTNTVAGLPQLFFYSGDATHSSNQYNATTQGTTFTLGGIIIKWGFLGPIGDHATISFPVAFPNNCYTVVATPVKSGSFGSLIFTLQTTPTISGFQVRTNGVTLDAVSYVAIGN